MVSSFDWPLAPAVGAGDRARKAWRVSLSSSSSSATLEIMVGELPVWLKFLCCFKALLFKVLRGEGERRTSGCKLG